MIELKNAAISYGGVDILTEMTQRLSPGSFYLLTGLGLFGMHWLLPLVIPVLAVMVDFWITQATAFRALSRLP